jgi:hypothetical protein
MLLYAENNKHGGRKKLLRLVRVSEKKKQIP